MATVYISPTGSGDKSGVGIENAAAISSLNGMIKKAGPGGTVALVADKGAYNVSGSLVINQAGADGAPVTIKGVNSAGAEMDAVFNGTRSVNYTAQGTSGNELFKLMAGANNLTFDNISVNNVGSAFRVGGNLDNLIVSDAKADNVGTFFQTYASGTATDATVTGLTLKGIDIKGFSRSAIRIGYDSSNVLIENVHGDSERQDGGDDFAIGVHITGTAHDVTISKTVMENAVVDNGAGYWNGDGFATERGTYDIEFVDTIARGNADGGYDLKSDSTTLTRALAQDNGRNYRVWGETKMVDSIALDPHVQGGSSSQVQIWVAQGAALVIKGGLISDSGSDSRVFDNSGTVNVDGTDIILATNAALNASKNLVNVGSGDLSYVASTGPYSVGTLSTPAAAPVAPTSILPPASALELAPAPAPIALLQKSTAASETLAGSDSRDSFDFTATSRSGADIITSFAKDDLLILKAALSDGNKDGLITFGKNGVLNTSTGTIKISDLDEGVRYLGKTSDGGFIYGDASARRKGMVEGTLNAGDALTGDSGDKKANRFFFDTNLGVAMGKDNIKLFGARDSIVTTSPLGDGIIPGSKVIANDGLFDLLDHGEMIGSLSVTTIKGAAATVLEYDGSRVVDGLTYHVYSLEGSPTDLGFLI